MLIHCSGQFFGEADKEKIDLITEKNAESFFVEKDTENSKMNLQVVKVSSETTDQKVHNILISKIGQKI